MSDPAPPPGGVRVSVVIPAYGRPGLLREAVLSVLRQDLEPDRYEVIVVDSSPDDRNVAVVEALKPEAACRLECLTKRAEGPGPSRNRGVEAARGGVIAFMDSDCRAAPGWLRAGLAAFDDSVGLVQGRTLPDPAAPRGVFSFYILVEHESPLYETANMFYRKEALEAVGGFAPDLNPRAETPMGSEDVIVAWSVKRRGWKSRFAADAVVEHEVRPLSLWNWIFIKRQFIYPMMIRKVPELRRFLFARYFLDRPQAFLVLGLIGLAAAFLHPAAALLCAPYVVDRAGEPTRTLSGWKRPLRAAVYLPRDLASLGLLIAGSLRYRRLVL